MDERTKTENEALRAMFQTDGWAVLMRNTQANLDNFRTGFPFNVDTLEQLYFTRGTMATLNMLLNIEAQLESQTEALEGLSEDE